MRMATTNQFETLAGMEDNLEDRENFNTQGAIINGKLLLEALLVNLENKEEKA